MLNDYDIDELTIFLECCRKIWNSRANIANSRRRSIGVKPMSAESFLDFFLNMNDEPLFDGDYSKDDFLKEVKELCNEKY